MKILRWFFGLALLGLLVGCGTNNSETNSSSSDEGAAGKIALVLGYGGVDDRSFNQAGWEGLTAWGKTKNLTAKEDFTYIETNDPADNSTNISNAVQNGYQTIISLSYLQADAVEEAAKQNPDLNFAIIDSELKGTDNIASATFEDQESAYLAGLAAAYSTTGEKVGFIGGMEGPVIARFEAGFKAGVAAGAKDLNKEITVNSQYAASYDAPDKGKAIAATMYEDGADIIYQAAGSTGAGVFQEAKARNESDETKKVWVVGVDRDQTDEGEYTAPDGTEGNFCLTSTKKNVGAAVKKIAQAAYSDKFPGGKHLTFGLKEDGVDLTDGQLSEAALTAVQTAKEKIIAGSLEIPIT